VNFAGLELRNPFILAAATPGWDGAHLVEATRAGAGAVIPKTIGPPAGWAAHPRNGRLALAKVGTTSIGMVNLELFTTKSQDDWLANDLAAAKEGGATIIASILANPDVKDTAQLARKVEATGCAEMLELNVSCPMPASTVGMHIGKDPDKTRAQVLAVKGASDLPLSVKLTPNIADVAPVAEACQEAGADALSVTNSVRAFAGVDIYSGRPRLRAFGGYTGPAIKPIIQRLVIEVGQACDLPISAIGGISSWQDAVEYIMLGATTVQVATHVMWKGWGVFTRLLDGFEKFMIEQGYASVEDMRGTALPHVTTTEALAQEPRKIARVDEEACNRCGLCVKSCFYDALVLDEQLAVDSEKCDGCGLCTILCPSEALQMVEP
jgi:dihydropyrimidine dehydrogenase (NAD+) subunit PreA